MAITLLDIMTDISVDFDMSPSIPVSTSNEYRRRLRLVNRFERTWARRLAYKWTDLYTEATLTTSTSVDYVALPSGIALGNIVLDTYGCLLVDSIPYEVVRPDKVDTNCRQVFITGNNIIGFRLNFLNKPSSATNFTLKYYTTNLATNTSNIEQDVLLVDTDKTKCPNHYYIVYGVLSVLYKTDDDLQKGIDYERQSFDVLSDMMANQMIQNQNEDQYIEDLFDDYPIGE